MTMTIASNNPVSPVHDEGSARALVLVDFVNDLIAPEGKLSGRGYVDFAHKHGTMERVEALLHHCRARGILVVHVRLGFSEDYSELPDSSPLLSGAKSFGAFKLGTWGANFHPKAAPMEEENRIVKRRVSAFYDTGLDVLLRARGIRDLMIAGCATDLAVQSTARDAHDRDYLCTIVSDCCVAASDDDHEQTLRMLGKIARVRKLATLMYSCADEQGEHNAA